MALKKKFKSGEFHFHSAVQFAGLMPPFLFHKRQPKNAIQDTNISANCAIEHLIMAENLPSAAEQELLGIKHLLWGPNVKAEIFKRWSQGVFHTVLFFTTISACKEVL